MAYIVQCDRCGATARHTRDEPDPAASHAGWKAPDAFDPDGDSRDDLCPDCASSPVFTDAELERMEVVADVMLGKLAFWHSIGMETDLTMGPQVVKELIRELRDARENTPPDLDQTLRQAVESLAPVEPSRWQAHILQDTNAWITLEGPLIHHGPLWYASYDDPQTLACLTACGKTSIEAIGKIQECVMALHLKVPIAG